MIGRLIFGLLNPVLANPSKGIPTDQQHRMIVLSDIEAEVDDTESFVRLLISKKGIGKFIAEL